MRTVPRPGTSNWSTNASGTLSLPLSENRRAGRLGPILGSHPDHVSFRIGEVPSAPRPVEDRRAGSAQTSARGGQVIDRKDQLAARGRAGLGRGLDAKVRGNAV